MSFFARCISGSSLKGLVDNDEDLNTSSTTTTPNDTAHGGSKFGSRSWKRLSTRSSRSSLNSPKKPLGAASTPPSSLASSGNDGGATALRPSMEPVMERTRSALTDLEAVKFLIEDWSHKHWRPATPQDQECLDRIDQSDIKPLVALGEGAYGSVNLCRIPMSRLPCGGVSSATARTASAAGHAMPRHVMSQRELATSSMPLGPSAPSNPTSNRNSESGSAQPQQQQQQAAAATRPGSAPSQRTHHQRAASSGAAFGQRSRTTSLTGGPMEEVPEVPELPEEPGAGEAQAEQASGSGGGAPGTQLPVAERSAGSTMAEEATGSSPATLSSSSATSGSSGPGAGTAELDPGAKSPPRAAEGGLATVDASAAEGEAAASGSQLASASSVNDPQLIVAVKRVPLGWNQERELMQLHRCQQCPFIVRLFGFVEDGDEHCSYVMEWAEGGDLAGMLISLKDRRGANKQRLLMSEASARYYMGCLLLALEFLHNNGLLHRDIKPSNLLLTSDGTAKLADLGFTVALDANGQTVGCCGTTGYIAPEVYAYGSSKTRSSYGVPADIWSAAATLFQVLTGSVVTDRPEEVLKKGWRPPTHPRFSPQLQDLFNRMLAAKPSKRPQTVASVMRHAWFAGFDWAALRGGRMTAPYVPRERRHTRPEPPLGAAAPAGPPGTGAAAGTLAAAGAAGNGGGAGFARQGSGAGMSTGSSGGPPPASPGGQRLATVMERTGGMDGSNRGGAGGGEAVEVPRSSVQRSALSLRDEASVHRGREGLVRAGANLQYCRKVSVSLVRSSSSNSSAGASAVNVAAGASVAAPAAMASGSLAATSQTPSELSAAPADAASPAAPHSHSAAAPATPEQPAHVPAAPETGMSTTTSTEVPCEVVQVLYAQPYTPAANPPPLHPVSLISNTLHHFTGSLIRRYLRPADAAAAAAAAATAAAPGLGLGLARGMPWRRWGRGRGGRGGAAAAAEGGATAASAAANGSSSEEEGEGVEVPADAAMPSRLLLRVTLPRSIAAGLLDGSLRGDAHLAVSARSDFHAVADVRVGVARHRVAILGTSPYAASLVQAALAAPAALAVAGRGESEAMGVAAAGAGLFGLPWLALPLAWSRPARAAGAAASAEAGAVPGGGAAAAPVWGVRLPFRAGRAGRQQAACAADAVGAPAVSSAASAAGALEAQVDAAAENTVAAALAAILAGTLGWPHSPQGDDGVIGVGPYGPAPRGYDRTRVVCADAPGDAPLRPAAAVAAAYYAAGLPPRPRPRPGLVQTALQFSGSLLRTKSQRRGEQQQQLQQVAAGLAGAAGVAERAAEEAAAQLLAASSEPAAAGRIARLPLLAARKQRASALGSRQGASGAVTSGDAGTAGQQARVPLPLPPQLAASLRAWAEVLPALGRWQLESGLRPTFAAAAVGAAAAIVAGTTGVATAVGAAAMLAGALGAATAPTHDGSAAVVSNMAVSVAATVAATAAAAASAVAGSEATIAAATAAAAAATLAAAMATTVVGSSVLTGAHGGVQAPSTTAAAGGRLAQASSPRPLMLGGRFPVLRAPELVAAAAPVSVSNGTGTSSLVTGAGVAAGPPGPLPPKYPGASPAPPRPPSRLAGPVAGAGAAAPRWVLRFGAAPAASPGIAPGGTPRPGSGSGSGGNNTQARGGAGGAGKALGRGWVLWWRPSASAAGSAAPAMPMDPQPAAPQRWGAQAAGRRVVKQQPLTAPPVVDAAAVAPPSARAATPLAHLRSQLLGSLSRGSGRAVLPLPPALAAEGLEFCNAMLEPLQPPAAAAAAAAIATAARPAVGLLRPLQPLQAQVRQMPQNYPGKPQPKGSTGRGAVAPVAVEAVPAAAVAAAPLAGQPPVAGLAPVVAMRRVTEGLRRQLLLHRGVWWRALVGGVVGALMRPVALVGMLGRLPIMGLQAFRRTGAQPLAAAGPAGAAGAAALAAASAAAAQLQATAAAAQPPPALTLPAAPAAAAAAAAGWEAVVVVGSCRDPLRALRTKDMAALRAHADTCPLVPVLLTCAGTPPGRRAAARDTLAAACGVEPGAVRVLVVEEALLHRPAALVPHTDLPTVWEQLGGCAGAAELRRAVRAAVTATRAAPEAATVTMPTTAEAAAAPWGVLAATGVAGSDGVGRAVGSRVEAVPGRVLAAGGAAAVAAEGTRRVRYHPLLSNSRA